MYNNMAGYQRRHKPIKLATYCNHKQKKTPKRTLKQKGKMGIIAVLLQLFGAEPTVHRFSFRYIYYCPRGRDGLSLQLSIVFVGVFFLCAPITHEPLDLARWNFAWTCTLTPHELYWFSRSWAILICSRPVNIHISTSILEYRHFCVGLDTDPFFSRVGKFRGKTTSQNLGSSAAAMCHIFV